jgi:hypothetical protein
MNIVQLFTSVEIPFMLYVLQSSGRSSLDINVQPPNDPVDVELTRRQPEHFHGKQVCDIH